MAPKRKISVDSIQWVERLVKLEELKPFERNPRRISKEAFEALCKSIAQDGYHQRILATNDLRVIGGHQRINAFKTLGYTSIIVLVPDRVIDDETFRRILIRDNLPFGEFDMDVLSTDFEIDELKEIGMPEDWLPSPLVVEEETEEEPEEKPTGFVVMVECRSESEQQALLQEMLERGFSAQAKK